jgi:hypothetical protein
MRNSVAGALYNPNVQLHPQGPPKCASKKRSSRTECLGVNSGRYGLLVYI